MLMKTAPQVKSARDWISDLSKYRNPSNWRSSFELAVTIIPFFALWVAACWALQYSYIAAFLISALNGAFLIRLFIIQHDCGHSSYFTNRTLSDWIGRALGVLTLTPYDVWKRTTRSTTATTAILIIAALVML